MFLKIAKKRFSCRSFKSDEIPDELLYKVLEAFRIAPSAVNYQPWHLLVVKDQKNKESIYTTYQRDWIKTAPVLLIACGDHSIAWKRKDGKDHTDVDISIAVDHLTLQATELGLATCWVCNFDRELLSKALSLPDNIEPIVIIPIGFPNDLCDPDRHSVKRKQLNEIVHWEKF